MTRIFFWGAGRCGRSLANALHHASHEIVGTWNRTAESAARGGERPWPSFWGARRPPALDEAEVVWVTVGDDSIATVAPEVLRGGHIALHASGAVPAAALSDAPKARAACHPIQSFAADMAGPEHLRGVWFGVQGDPEAVDMGRALVADMGGESFVVAGEDEKALYHAACCVASNAMVALADQAVALFHAAGVSREDSLRALAPLIRGTAENLAGTGEARDVLTGPIARGDEAVIARHEAAIERLSPASLTPYRDVCAAIRRMLAEEAP